MCLAVGRCPPTSVTIIHKLHTTYREAAVPLSSSESVWEARTQIGTLDRTVFSFGPNPDV